MRSRTKELQQKGHQNKELQKNEIKKKKKNERAKKMEKNEVDTKREGQKKGDGEK